MNLETAIQRGLRWAAIRQTLAVLAGTVGVILYSRVLPPADVGAARLAAIVYSGMLLLVQAPAYAAVIYYRDERGEHDSAAFWLLIAAAPAAAAAVMVAAGPLAGLLQTPVAAGLVRVAALSFLAQALAAVPAALLLKQFRFAVYERLQIATIALQFAGWVTLPRAGWGPWSLVLPQLAAALLWAAGVWSAAGFRPRRPARAALGDVVRYARSIAGGKLLGYLTSNVDNLAAGTLGAQALGLYSFGEDQSSVAANSIGPVVAQVALPALAAVNAAGQEPAEERRRIYLEMLRLAAGLSAPVHVVLLVAAGLGIPLLVGEQWSGALGVYRIYVLYRLIDVLLPAADAAMAAAGRPEVRFAFEVAQFPLFAAAVLFALGAGGGVASIALAAAAVRAVMGVLYLAATFRITRTPWRAALRHLLPAFAAAGLTGACLSALESGGTLLRLAGGNPVLAVLALVAGGLLLYPALLFALDRRGFKAIARMGWRILVPLAGYN